MSKAEENKRGQDVSIVLCGQAGQGVQTVEFLLTRLLKRAGFHVFATKEYMSRVRGGANSTTIRVSDRRVQAFVSRIDILVALNQGAVEHVAERLSSGTLILGDRTVVFRHLGLGHTDNDIVILTSGVTFAGDLVEEGAPPAFQDSYPLEWPATVTTLLDAAEGPVVPGHGRVVDPSFVSEQRDELAEVKRLAEERNLDGMDPEEAAAAGGPYPAEVLLPAFQRAWRHLAEQR